MRLPKRPPPWDKLLASIQQDPKVLFRRDEAAVRVAVDRANDEGWTYEDAGYRTAGTGLTRDQLWVFIKSSRMADRQTVPLTDAKGRSFSFRLPPAAHRILRLIDLNLGGSVNEPIPRLDTPDERIRYLISSLTEEAIASSQLEGAAVTRKDAKDMLRSGRPPRTPHERMIVNNYRAIQFLNRRSGEAMTVPLLCDIQRQLTEGTLQDEGEAGRFRRTNEDIAVWDGETNEPVHVPPSAEELPGRAVALCAFANEPADGMSDSGFIHPAVRAIVLHFWLGYDHPFCDGNGRTARALFYWSMLRAKYWLVEYLTISEIIRGHPKQYGRAYLATETDDNDLTYFILYHLQVIERGIRDFLEHLRRKHEERVRLTDVLQTGRFNPRQQAILTRALRDPTTRFTYESHRNSHDVTLPTARADLLDLESVGLLIGNRFGRRFEFVAATDLEARLRKLARGRKR